MRRPDYRIDQVSPDLGGRFLAEAGLRDWMPMPSASILLAAWVGGRIVGVGGVHRYWLHPKRWRLQIFVDTAMRRRDIGSALFDALATRLPAGERQVQAALYARDAGGRAFLRHLGFRLLMTTRMGELDPARVSSEWRDGARHDLLGLRADGYRLESLASCPAMRGDVAVFHGAIYAAQHTWNPPVALTQDQCVSLYLDERELEPAMQYMLVHYGSIRAVASLRRTDDPERLDLGWVGVVDRRDAARKMVRALVGRCVECVAEKGANVTLEIDRVDRDVNAVVDELPVEWGDSWLTYSRDLTLVPAFDDE